MTAVGTASPIAHGQAMTSTATAAAKARTAGAASADDEPDHEGRDRRATARPGTKIPLMRSASFWMGPATPCASRISRTMRASTVSAPTAVAR